MVAIVDTRASSTIDVTGCKLLLLAPQPIGPNEYEDFARNTYPNGITHEPFWRSALRVGIEASKAWLRVNSEYPRFRTDSSFSRTPLPSRTESHSVGRGWASLHLGLELALR